jgi:hypothetical protein
MAIVDAATQQWQVEVGMFSLIALYFEYRKLQAARGPSQPGSVGGHSRPANDAGSHRVVANAA